MTTSEAAAQAVIETEQLTRRFGQFVAADSVTLQVARGSIFGFLGPSGSGKTTTMRMLCGLLKPTSGRGVVGGFDIERQSEELRAVIGYMSQRFSLYPDLSVRENLEFYGGVYGLDRARLTRRTGEVSNRLGITDRLDRLTADLPLGMKQRVALGAALLHEPPVLFLDEPTSGVDPASRRLFWEILDELAAGGTSVLVTTHAMDEAERCDHVAIMYRGKVIAAGSPQHLRAEFGGVLYYVEAEPLLQALDAARALSGVEDAAMFGTALHVTARDENPTGIRGGLERAGLTVGDIRSIEPTMEDVFVQSIRRSERDAAPAGGGGQS